MAKIIRTTNKSEWLQHRSSGIGSSEVATILGINPYETIYALWRKKKGMDTPTAENQAMKMGHKLEGVVAELWTEETGRGIVPSSEGDWIAVDEQRSFLRVSPDRLFWVDSSATQGVLEIKTTQRQVDVEAIPQYWYAQLQYQLGVMGLQHGALAWLVNGRDFGCTDVAFSPDFYAWVVEEVSRFWTDCIVGNSEPAPTTASDINTKFAQHRDGLVVEAGADVLEAYGQLVGIRSQLAQLHEREAAAEQLIKAAMGEAEALAHNGRTLATWRTSKPSTKFDSKKLLTDRPELGDIYSTPVAGSRRFILK